MTKTIPLIPDGDQVPVTRENLLQYIYLVSDYRLNKQMKRQSDAFIGGLSEMISPNWLRCILLSSRVVTFDADILECSGCSTSESCRSFLEV